MLGLVDAGFDRGSAGSNLNFRGKISENLRFNARVRITLIIDRGSSPTTIAIQFEFSRYVYRCRVRNPKRPCFECCLDRLLKYRESRNKICRIDGAIPFDDEFRHCTSVYLR